ncbi:MAG: iron-containing alcohol dehydrogenase [Rikenellaceae bacterium]|nr:iron-containing alcohol dehydrogenase [Rikenellaceae bacterium]
MFYNSIKTPVIMKTGRKILGNINYLLNDAHLFFPAKILVTQENLYELYREDLDKTEFEKILFIKGGNVEETANIMAECRESDALIIAFGGGSVLDAVKYSASTIDKPYITIPSALSNDAIYSTVARLVKNGQKVGFDVQPPMGIIVDIDVIRNSPRELLLAGIADLVSNLSAIQDWLLSHNEIGEPINELAFMLAKESAMPILHYSEEDLFSDKLILDLVNGLITSGLSMSISGNTRGASGAEHMISHAIDKYYPEKATIHGLQVGWALQIIEKRYRGDEYGINDFFERIGIKKLIEEKVPFSEEDFDALVPLAKKIRKRYTILNKI